MVELANRLLELARRVHLAVEQGRHDAVAELLDQRDEIINALRRLAGTEPLPAEAQTLFRQLLGIDAASAALMESTASAVNEELARIQRGRMALSQYGQAGIVVAEVLDRRG